MGNKANETRAFILERVSPIFNEKGYVGTSLSDITKATQLTKGAIYGNFLNKEDLAMHAFRHNIRKIVFPLMDVINATQSSLGKLKAITQYYRNYYQMSIELGGCPVLNVGTDAKNLNPLLFAAAKEISNKLINGIEKIIKDGQNDGEILQGADPRLYSRNLYSMIEGGIFTALTNEDESFLLDVLDHIDQQLILALKP